MKLWTRIKNWAKKCPICNESGALERVLVGGGSYMAGYETHCTNPKCAAYSEYHFG